MRNNATIMHLHMYHHFLQAFPNLQIFAFASITGFKFLGLPDFSVILYRLFKKLTEKKVIRLTVCLFFFYYFYGSV